MRVFLSYQRSDTLWVAHAVSQALQRAGHEVFLDNQSIGAGKPVWSEIQAELRRTNLLLVLIGREFQVDRLHAHGDFVSKEWRYARFTGCPVHQVLVDRKDAVNPKDLPDELRWIAAINAHRLRSESASDDLRGLAVSVAQITSERAKGVARALWIDDNPANNERERRELRGLGVVFDNVVSNEEAREQLQMARYDLIITDYWRTRGSDSGSPSGADVFEMARDVGPPVIVYTSPRYTPHFDDLLERGAYGVTASPFELLALVRRAFGVVDD